MADFRLCSIPNCGKRGKLRRGLCNRHYSRLLRLGDPLAGKEYQRQGPICSVPDCGKPSLARGWCSAHWHRHRRLGDPLGGGKMRAPVGEPLRYLREVVLAFDGDECLIWPYARTSSGYGNLGIEDGNAVVSRLVCERVYGPPPTPDHEAAHSCGRGHEGCVTQNHLSWKTATENQADRVAHGTVNSGQRNGRWKHGRYAA